MRVASVFRSVVCSLPVRDAMQFHVQLLQSSCAGCYAVPCSVDCSLPVWVASVFRSVACSLHVWDAMQFHVQLLQSSCVGCIVGGLVGRLGWGESGRGKVVSRTDSYSPVCLLGWLGWGSAAKFCCDVLHL